MNSTILWKIGIAIMAGILCGYLIAVKFGVVMGLVLGSALAGAIADINAIRNTAPLIWKDFWAGYTSDVAWIEKSPKIFTRRGAWIRYFCDIIVQIVLVMEVVTLMALIPSLLLQICFPNLFTSLLTAIVVAVVVQLVAVMMMVGVEVFFKRVCKPSSTAARWVLIRKICAMCRMNLQQNTNHDSGIDQMTSELRRAFPWKANGKVTDWQGVGVSLICSIALVLLPVVLTCALGVVVLVLAVVVVDTLLTAFFVIATSRSVAAGVLTAMGIMVEYCLYPSIGATAWEAVRLVTFSVVGGGLGMVLYHWRTKLLLQGSPHGQNQPQQA